MPRSRPSIGARFDPEDAAGLPAADEPSKSELKRRMHDLQELGEAVASLPDDRLDALKLEDRLRDAITELGRTRSFEGRRRQLQYIGKLMKFEDADALREAVASYRIGTAKDTLALHEAEMWRDRLLAEDNTFDEWLRAHPSTDTQQMRSLVRAARKEKLEPGARHGRAYRDLFRLVKRHMLEQPEDGGVDASPTDPSHDD
jgi:ribosome-associated protein